MPRSATSTRLSRRPSTTETCAAILLEPIQGEGGINLPARGLPRKPAFALRPARASCLSSTKCRRASAAPGSGSPIRHWGVLPDVFTLAKALAGGVAMGALVAKPEVAEKLKPGTHAATFGGNPLAAKRRTRHHRNDRTGRACSNEHFRSARSSTQRFTGLEGEVPADYLDVRVKGCHDRRRTQQWKAPPWCRVASRRGCSSTARTTRPCCACSPPLNARRRADSTRAAIIIDSVLMGLKRLS